MKILKNLQTLAEDPYWVRDPNTGVLKKYDDKYLRKDATLKEPTEPLGKTSTATTSSARDIDTGERAQQDDPKTEPAQGNTDNMKVYPHVKKARKGIADLKDHADSTLALAKQQKLTDPAIRNALIQFKAELDKANQSLSPIDGTKNLTRR